MMTRAVASILLAFVISLPAVAEDAPKLGLPIACEPGKTCWVQQYADHDPSPGVTDYACGAETYDGHDGTDIRIRDTASSADVIAAAAGTVKAVRDGMDDHLIRTDADRKAIANHECGNGALVTLAGGWETQYCHMRKGSVAVKAGDQVVPGQRLGQVGFSGMAAFPHVHLTVRKDGKPVDPFRPVDGDKPCGGAETPLWTTAALSQLAYDKGDIIRAGFAPGPVEMAGLEDGSPADALPASDWPALIAYAWAINLAAGDSIKVSIDGPDGFAAANAAGIERAKAQYMLFAGKKRPAGGWPRGTYTAKVEVMNGGTVRLSQTWRANLD